MIRGVYFWAPANRALFDYLGDIEHAAEGSQMDILSSNLAPLAHLL